MKKILVLLAEGFEEIEALTPVDYLRRAGFEVVVAGVTGELVTGAKKITVKADVLLDNVKNDFDAIIVPGGMGGTKNISKSSKACQLITDMYNQQKIVAAICAAPVVVLAKLGLLKNKNFTCYPNMENSFEEYCGKDFAELTSGSLHSFERVVIDQNLITSRGAGTAEEFAFSIIEKLSTSEKAKEIANAIVAR